MVGINQTLMNNLLKTKHIGIITVVLALSGLIITIFPIYPQSHESSLLKIVKYIVGFTATVNLSFFNMDWHEFSFPSSSRIINSLDMVFYLMMLTGGVLNLISRQKENRLIRFCFSIILFTCLMSLLFSALTPFKYSEFFTKSKNVFWFRWSLGLLHSILFFMLSYWIMKKLKSIRNLEVVVVESDTVVRIPFVPATRWQRFFHLIIDLLFCILLFSSVMMSFGAESFRGLHLEKMAALIGERGVVYLILILLRFIYYFVFETILGATPGKYLTETRVIDETGQKPATGAILLRTITRFVPFEPFSFFAYGWHDTWTNTQVVKEKRTGVYGGLYFTIIPAFLILGFGTYFGLAKYQAHQRYLIDKSEFNDKVMQMENSLKQISVNHIIQLKDLNGYSSDGIYLKIETVNKDSVYCSIMKLENDYNIIPADLEKKYEENITGFPGVNISRKVLENAFIKDYDSPLMDSKRGVDILNDGGNYRVERVIKMYEPILEDDGGAGSFQDSSIYFQLANRGSEGYIVEIKNLKGNLK